MFLARVLCIGLAAMLALASPAATQVAFKPGQFTSSQVCGSCHQDIYNTWKDLSVHAKALNRAFMDAYREANEASGGKTKALCLTCHAPTTVLTRDYDLTQPISREAITCDFCHSLKGIRLLDADNPFDLDVGAVKRGPLQKPEPKVHQAVQSDLHTSSLLCAGCHEYRNPNGVALMTTYSEWESGPYPKEAVHCQGCHMPLFKGELVLNQATQRLDRIFINLHQLPGGHSQDQLRRALRMDVTEVRREPDRTLVRVEVFNDGAGHRVPTGLPSRRVVLDASVKTPEGRAFQQQRVYQKVVLDASGKPIGRDSRLFLEGASIREDSRIAPRERRLETFEFPVPRIQAADLKVRLYYDYASMTQPEKRSETDILTIERKLARE